MDTNGKTITNNGTIEVKGKLNITDTNQLAGNNQYKIALGGALQLGGSNYIAEDDAIVKVDGEVNVLSNTDDGYTFTIPEGVKATVAGSNSDSGSYYHHGKKDVINVTGTLIIAKRFANHGTIDVKEDGTLKILEDVSIFAAPTNSSGKIILASESSVEGEGTIEGIDNPVAGNTYEWNGTTWTSN